MADFAKTVRIKSTHPPSQGEFVEINEDEFDPKRHELFDDEPAKRGPARQKKISDRE